MKWRRSHRLPSLRGRIIASSLFTAVVLLVVCTTILFMLILNVLRGYIHNDLEFVLQQTLSNMDDKTLLVEDTLLRLRSDEELMAALESEEGFSEERQEEREALLQEQAGLGLTRNSANLSKPFLDMVYLYDRNGACIRVSYRENTPNVQETWDAEYDRLYRRFQAWPGDVQVVRARNHINIINSLRAEDGERIGTVIFGVNENAFLEMAAQLDQYPGSFWLIFDPLDTRVFASRGNPMEAEDIKELATGKMREAVSHRAGYTDYLVCTQRFHMGLGGMVAIPENYFSTLLYDSVKYYLLAMAVVITLLGLVLLMVSVRLTRPLMEMADRMQRVTNEHLDTRLPAYRLWEYNTISTTFNTMLDNINHLISDVYEKKLLVMDSEMKFLQSQMNPHFMYNVLNTMALKAKIDGNEEIYRMASSFAGLTQARLSRGGEEQIPLEQEMQYVNFYLELQRSRFEEKLKVSIDIPPQLRRARIPKLALEMIVENAVVHGIEPKFGAGTVSISARQEGEELRVTVEDDGVGFAGCSGPVPLPLPGEDPRPGHNHVAINNVWRIIRHFYGEPYGIFIFSKENEGTQVVIRIPLELGGEEINV